MFEHQSADPALLSAIDALTRSVTEQGKLQEETNTLLRRLIQVTAENSQELLDLREQLAKPKPAAKAPAAPPSGVQRRG